MGKERRYKHTGRGTCRKWRKEEFTNLTIALFLLSSVYLRLDTSGFLNFLVCVPARVENNVMSCTRQIL